MRDFGRAVNWTNGLLGLGAVLGATRLLRPSPDLGLGCYYFLPAFARPTWWS
jgi:hypothetical protein